MHTGCPTHIITRIPHQRKLAEGVGRLSAEARQRLRSIDWHRLESGKFSADGNPQVIFQQVARTVQERRGPRTRDKKPQPEAEGNHRYGGEGSSDKRNNIRS